MVWSPQLKFQIWGRLEQWFLRYSTYIFLSSSSIGGCPQANFRCWFGPLRLSSKFEQDYISDYWVIPIFIFWGCLPLKVLFISRQFSNLVCPHEIKFKILERFDQWILSYSTFNILRSSSIKGCLHFKQYSILIWSPKFNFKIWVRSDERLLRLSLLIFWGRLPLLHFKQYSVLVCPSD